MTKPPLSDHQARPSVAAQRTFWNEHWQHWQARHALNAWAHRRNDAILECLRSLRLGPARILDLGCGPGWFTDTLAQFGDVTGVDLSEEAIAMARARAPHVRFLAADLYRADLPLGHFDVVVSQEVLGHVEDHGAYVDRAADLLRPGGHLLLATPNRFVLDRLGDGGWASYPSEHIDDHLDRRGLRRLLERRFRVLRLSTIVPIGQGGILRVTNSAKLNRALGWLISEQRMVSLKEAAGLGYQLVALAQKPGERRKLP